MKMLAISTVSNRTNRGISLIIVLGSLVFLTTLVVAFLIQMGTELKSSKLYADGASARILSQSATNIVMAEIIDATKGVDASGQPLAWASQPGMIRTFDALGNPKQTFKLYSWDTMKEDGPFDPSDPANQVPMTGANPWNTQKAIYTDMNQPVLVSAADGSSRAIFPVVDGNDLVDGATLSPKVPLMKPNPSATYLTYDAPKRDPATDEVTEASDGVPDVEGFFAEAPDSYDASLPVSPKNNPVPMPVKWLYVLANGRIVAPTSDPSGLITNVEGADVSPIVGRIAFWADDESCKVNINTASEGTYWDAPKGSSAFDEKLADFQPAQFEYQRYPGHPATTSLSAVFPDLKPVFSAAVSQEAKIYQITPRIKGGPNSSLGGTVNVHLSGAAPLVPDSDRLYASVNEFLFTPERAGNESSVLNKHTSERTKFFLTSSSRAPDLNLFDRPRVSLWPLHAIDDAAHRTAFDKLIDFCSTVNGHSFSFHRANPLSPTADLPATQAPSARAELNRNRELLEYLRDLTNKSVPGFGGSFAAKYASSNGAGGTDRDQILTEIFDYIRSTNLDDTTLAKENRFNYYVPPPEADSRARVGQGTVVPIYDAETNTRGFGRYPAVQGAALIFLGQATSATDPAIAAGFIRTQAWFVLNLFTPTMGMVQMRGNFKIRVTGLNQFKWDAFTIAGVSQGQLPMGLPATKTIVPKYHPNEDNPNYWGVHSVGGSGDIKSMTAYANSGNLMLSGTTYMNQGGQFGFKGGVAKVEIVSTENNEVFQTIELDFPDATFPVPDLAPAGPTVGNINFRSVVSRINSASGNIGGCSICSKDVVRSIVPANGDLRLVFPRKTILATDADYPSFFKEHEFYSDPAEKMAHSMRTEDNQPYYGSTGGRLLKLAYKGWTATSGIQKYLSNYESAPGGKGQTTLAATDSSVVPASQANDILGDWDTGVGHRPDGPYINKADEGDVRSDFASYVDHRPYFGWTQVPIISTLFSPNRMMPSAGMLGSLPTGVWAKEAWQTLLFCPNPLLPLGSRHKGAGEPASGPPYTTPPDHLFLDLFHMPVVEPYAISEPLSTAGRVNMNYQIVPFSHITRSTGINAVLKSEKVIALANADAATYKRDATFSSPPARFDIDVAETLRGFEARFDRKDIFRSASEICEVGLVPAGVTYTGLESYWQSRQLTGDNARERPYTTIYPRLTTRSNTFTIHVRAQLLKKAKGSASGQWDERRDQITGEYRGTQTIERYIDPNDVRIEYYADPAAATPISEYYKYRVVNTKQFAP